MGVAERDSVGTVRPDSIPASHYISRDFARLEAKAGVWTRTWQMACREEQLVKVGDFATLELGDDSIIVVRSAPDRIVAHHNVCMHRGRRLKNRNEPSGNTNPLLFCRYHGWRWNLDGSLNAIPGRENWEGCPHFADDDLALRPVRVGRWGGWIWINMDPAAEPLEDYLAPVQEYLDCFAFEDMRLVWSHSIRVPANWKTVLEAFIESYHAPTTHAQTNKFDTGFGSGQPFGLARGRHGQMFIGPALEVTPPEADQRAFFRGFMVALREQFQAMYFDPSLTAGDRLMRDLPEDASLLDVIVAHYTFQRERAEELGQRWPEELTLENIGRAGFDWHVFPNLVILPTPDGVVTYRTRPDGDDPNQCFWDLQCAMRVPPGERPDYVHTDFADVAAFKGRNMLMEQDLQNIVEVQAGMRSSAFLHARANPYQETVVSHFHTTIVQMIEACLAGPDGPTATDHAPQT